MCANAAGTRVGAGILTMTDDQVVPAVQVTGPLTWEAAR
jgi:hypothetical protein